MNHPLILEALMIQQLQRQRVQSEWERHALERRERDGEPAPQSGLLARVQRGIVAWVRSRRHAAATPGVTPVEA